MKSAMNARLILGSQATGSVAEIRLTRKTR
jgi:hypothetical protein